MKEKVSNSSKSDCNVGESDEIKSAKWVNYLPPSATVDPGPGHSQLKSNLTEELLR